jgi:hypothetical protein
MVSGNIAVTLRTYDINKNKVEEKINKFKSEGEESFETIREFVDAFDEIKTRTYDASSIDSEKEIQLLKDISILENILGKLVYLENENSEDLQQKIVKLQFEIRTINLKLRESDELSRFESSIISRTNEISNRINEIENSISVIRPVISNATKINDYKYQIQGIKNETETILGEASKIGNRENIVPDIKVNNDSDIQIIDSISYAANDLISSFNNNSQIIRSMIFSSFDYDAYDDSRKVTISATNEITRLKDDLTKLEMEDGFSNPKFNQSAHYFKIDKLKKLISKKEDELRILKNKTNSSVNISIQSVNSYTDLNLVAIRKFQSDVREALKEFNNSSKNKTQTKEWKYAVRKQLINNIDNYFENLSNIELIDNVRDYARNVISKTSDNKTSNTLNSIRLLLSDNDMQIKSSKNVILSDIKKGIKIEDDRTKFASKSVVMIYMLKSLRVAVAWLAFYLADTLFKDYYIKQKYGKKEIIVDLRWYVVIYASFQFIFDIIALIVMYFVRRIDPEVVSGALILDYAFDALIVTLMVLASSIWVADIIQDKRYFMYKTSTTRATRVLKTIMFWLLVIHSITPYYYLTGPNFTGSKSAKDFDEKIKKKVKVIEE